MEPILKPLVHDLLAWLARQPRTHAEVMESWRTSCPRLPVWEECTDQGFVTRNGRLVEVTSRGRAFLESGEPPAARPMADQARHG